MRTLRTSSLNKFPICHKAMLTLVIICTLYPQYLICLTTESVFLFITFLQFPFPGNHTSGLFFYEFSGFLFLCLKSHFEDLLAYHSEHLNRKDPEKTLHEEQEVPHARTLDMRNIKYVLHKYNTMQEVTTAVRNEEIKYNES